MLTGSHGNTTYATLEWKREVLSALWNALSKPPSGIFDVSSRMRTEGNNFGDETVQLRDMLLRSICEKEMLLKRVIGMIKCFDSDAMYFSLSIINAVHRRMLDRIDKAGNIKRALDEAECLNALEAVCETVSANVQYGAGRDWDRDNIDSCAEIGANLIDDFYDEELIFMDTSNGFVFEMNNNIPQQFDFSGMRQTEVSPPSSANGLGRGRKHTAPAWMTRK